LILVTGGAGFIGSNLVHALNARGVTDLVVVDNLERGDKFKNLVGARIAGFADKRDFLAGLDRQEPDAFELIVHQGACTSTTEPDGRYVMASNYDFSRRLIEQFPAARLVYASSAAVYGAGRVFREERAHERPLNIYGFSKWLFDEHVRAAHGLRLAGRGGPQLVGLRYFNVYGPREGHKGPMASVVRHVDDQLRATGRARLFGASDGFGPGEQRRDLVHVDDVVAVILWFLDHPDVSGLFNVGTGNSRSFAELAAAVIAVRGRGEVEHVPFPDSLRGRYQAFTEADLTRLRGAGYTAGFRDLATGVTEYLAQRDRDGD
jgi:ADP-L-glycero-D-manno-heptose 6-epimerase